MQALLGENHPDNAFSWLVEWVAKTVGFCDHPVHAWQVIGIDEGGDA